MALATELSYLPGSCTARPYASDTEAESPLEATTKLFDLPTLLVGGGLELTLRPIHALIWFFRF